MGPEREVAARVQRAAQGDRESWEWLVEVFSPVVWGVIRSCGLNREDGADIYQLTWLKLLDHIDRLREPERVGGWLATTARNECRHHFRSARRAHPAEIGDLEAALHDDPLRPAPPAVDEDLLRAEDAQRVRAAFAELPPQCQDLLLLLIVQAPQGPPEYRQVAQELGMPVGSLGPTRGRCLRKLEALLAEQGGPAGDLAPGPSGSAGSAVSAGRAVALDQGRQRTPDRACSEQVGGA